jgi:hypothetical protein
MTQEGGGEGLSVHCPCTVGCLAEGPHSKKLSKQAAYSKKLVIFAASSDTPDRLGLVDILL